MTDARYARVAQAVWMLAAAVWVAVMLWQVVALPERVPSHWGSNGDLPDSWSSKVVELSVVFGLGVATFCMPGLAGLARRHPWAINAPNVAWWTATTERLEVLVRLLRDDLRMFSAATLLLLAVLSGATVVAAHDAEGRMPQAVPMVATGVYVLVTIALCIRLVRSTRYEKRPDLDAQDLDPRHLDPRDLDPRDLDPRD